MLISILANSVINFELFHTTFPSVSSIINGKGEILKYRAIYLDSLRKSKYHNVETDNLFDNFNSGCPVPKYYNVNMRIDTRDGQIWKIEFDTLINCKEEKVTFTDAKGDMKGRIYKWLQTPANKNAGNR